MPLSLIPWEAERWADDLAIAEEIGNDYGAIVPEAQKLAEGADGEMTVSLPFVLISVSTDFNRQGVGPDRIIRLSDDPGTAANVLFGSDREIGVVVRADRNALTIRRVGYPANQGQGFVREYTSPSTHITTTQFSGINFLIASFDPQTRRVTQDTKEALAEYGPPDFLASRLSDSLLRNHAVYRVVAKHYQLKATRLSSSGEGPDRFAGEADRYNKLADQEWAKIVARLSTPYRVLTGKMAAAFRAGPG
jgi:hypothetical protein